MTVEKLLAAPVAWWMPRAAAAHEFAESAAARRVRVASMPPQPTRSLHRDPLTGLSTRHALMERIARMRQGSPGAGTVAVLILAGIDGFTGINDALGHEVGDWFLRVVASRLRDLVAPVFAVARTGGDEFAVLIDHAPSGGQVAALVQRVAAAIAAPVDTAQGRVAATASIGIAVHDDAQAGEPRLLEHASMAMADVKTDGGNAWRYFDAGMRARRTRSFELNQAIHRPEIDEQLDLHYQPVVDLARRELCGMEALMRWNLPDTGPVLPSEFIPLAERDDAIVRLGDWALRRACRQAAAWRSAGLRTVPIAVNLSPRQLAQRDFADSVLDALQESALPTECVELEITETAAMSDSREACATLARLADRGLRLAIDDFGTGYSSLSRLQSLPVHTLKIDRSFVTGLAHEPRNVAVVAAIVALAKSLRLVTIAEGVETQAQADILLSLGCDRCQGYLYSPPVDSTRAREMLRPG